MNGPEWADGARDELADIWVLATPQDRSKIESAVLDFVRDLGDDPFLVGESRDGDMRIAVRMPLVFWFRVGDKARWVRIVSVSRPAGS